MDESDITSESVLYQQNDATVSSSAAVAAIATTSMKRMDATGDRVNQNSRSRLVTVAETSCTADSMIPSPCLTAQRQTATRTTEGREVHHVTFAEPCNKYVHSDSGIVLSPDDSDFNDVTGDGQCVLTDDECAENDGGDEVAGQAERPVRISSVTNKVPGRPIIKLHRCLSTDSHDNPFLSDGELRRKADYIVTHSTFLRSYVRIADPDQIQIEPNTNDKESVDRTENNASEQIQDSNDIPNNTSHVTSTTTTTNITSTKCQDSPSKVSQKTVSKEDQPIAIRNGEADEPLLVYKKEGNGLEASRNKPIQSKKHICCILQ